MRIILWLTIYTNMYIMRIMTLMRLCKISMMIMVNLVTLRIPSKTNLVSLPLNNISEIQNVCLFIYCLPFIISALSIFFFFQFVLIYIALRFCKCFCCYFLVSSSSFSIGLTFYYWPWYKKHDDDAVKTGQYKPSELCVDMKFSTFKQEILEYGC